MATDRYDVIIIGTGAGGGTLARRLAPSGKRILILERGGFLPREQENWDSRAVFIDGRYKAHEPWIDKNGKPFHPGIHYYVGGNTKVYGSALFRLRREDFGELRHHGGLSPAWPIQYEHLAPYYLEAETWYHVHGQRGGDPTEPPESAPYPHAPLPHEPRIQKLNDDLVKLGLRPFHLPIGVNLDDDTGTPTAPHVLGHFDGFPDPTEAKADSHVVGIKPALKHPNVTLKTHTYVERLAVSPSGREVTEVHAKDQDGKAVVYRAGIVVVACGAINSAALLLRSACDTHPQGLANRSGVVGRHYMCHHNSALLAISLEPNPSRFQKTLGINDYYFKSDDFEFPLGHIQMLGKTDADQLRSDAPGFAPGMALEQMAAHSVDFWLTSEDLPEPDNRVTLEPDGNIRLRYTSTNTEGHDRLTRKLKGLLSKIGFREGLFARSVYLGKKIPIAGTAHQCGTVRFGTDPAASALDVNCRAHDVANLYVVDGSFFPSSGAVNPALTIMANAIRVGDHILKQL
ncbi:MAG: dehydrogenase [Tepidisphaera sp.]|nr:dehydrogenase [Tepidisphaera sp.]